MGQGAGVCCIEPQDGRELQCHGHTQCPVWVCVKYFTMISEILTFSVNSHVSVELFLCVSQSSQRSSEWMRTTVKPRTQASPWSSSPWFGPIHLLPSPLWTSLASWWPTPLTYSFWIREATPGWPITRWGSHSVASQGMPRWMSATVWEQCRATSHWQVSGSKRKPIRSCSALC